MNALNIITTDKVQSLFPTSPETCSKYESCSANVCPLDREWHLRSHLRGEPSCHYLRIAVKDRATPEEELTPAYQAAVELWDKHKDELPQPLIKQLEKASTFGRKIAPLEVDPERAATAMKRLEKIFGGADTPISRFN